MLTVLFPTNAQALAFRRRHAASDDPCSFGASVMSVGSWIADVWSLEGDGRSIASNPQRLMAFYVALASSEDGVLPCTLGMVKLLARLADEVLGSDEFEEVLNGGREVASRFAPLVDALRRYERVLDDAMLVDAGRACHLMAAYPGLVKRGGRARVYDAVLSAAQRKLADVQFDGLESCSSFDGRISKPKEGVELRFAFPSGRYAEPFLLADIVVRYASQGTVLMTARDPFALYGSLADALRRAGVECAVRARRPFVDTDFGRACLAVRAIVDNLDADKQSCADFLLNPFSGVSSEEAYDLDAMLRGDRLLSRDACLDALRRASRTFEYFEELVESTDSDALLGYFEDRARMCGGDEAFVAEQLAAISALRDTMTAARRAGAGVREVFDVAGSLRVDASRATSPADPRVLIIDARQVETAGDGVWNTVVMCDMDNVSFPVKNVDDAAVAFAGELGIARPRYALDDLRRAFAVAVGKAADSLVIERRLNDESADPTYPAATVEEFVDCFRDDPTLASEIDNRYSLPPCLMEGLLERGEESLYANAALCDAGQERIASVAEPTLFRISTQDAKKAVVLPRVGKGGVVVREPCFSASQIESYLECPQKWFALRRLRLDDIDEGFGAVEMGDFSHGVLEAFYRRFQEGVAAKVNAETLDEARRIIDEVIVEQRRAQYERKPSSNRLVPVSAFEEREVDDLADRLKRYLGRESCLLPDFAPYAFEYEIPVHEAFDYAGCKLVGKIDRIDVDGRGRAVVIDYKSSLSPDYDLYEPNSRGAGMKEGKVQALIYAQAVRRLLGFEVVGALYVGYGRLPKASGALSCDIEPAHIPGLRAETCVYRGDFGSSLHDLLDATEQRIASALHRLMEGEISARPLSSGVCSYCPEISCPQRRG